MRPLREYGYLFLVLALFVAVVNILRFHQHSTTEGSTSNVLLYGFVQDHASSTEEDVINTSLLDDDSIVPLRSREQKLFAQRCTRAHRGGVYMKHNRKAGGSSLYAVLQPAVCPNTPVFSSELPSFNVTHSFQSMSNATVWLTSLRHPVDRILSLYWFEGRWPRTCNMACEANKTKDDTTKVAELDEWIESVFHQTNIKKFKLRPHTACGQWQSVENYYIRQLLGVDRGDGEKFLNITLTRDHLQQAKQVLLSLDLVLIQERFSGKHHDPNMIRMFRSITGTPPKPQMPHHRQGQEKKASYRAPSPRVLKRLQQLNQLDLELYDYAKQLSRKTVQDWVQREQQEALLLERNPSLLNACVPPTRELTKRQADVLLWGRGCTGHPFFYYSPEIVKPPCLLHSGSW